MTRKPRAPEPVYAVRVQITPCDRRLFDPAGLRRELDRVLGPHWTIRRAVRALVTSRATVGAWLTGKRTPDLEAIGRAAAWAGLDLAELLPLEIVEIRPPPAPVAPER